MPRLLACLLIVWALFSATLNAAEPAATTTRTIHFPQNQSIGKLWALRIESSEDSEADGPVANREYLGEARGGVTLPAATRLELAVDADAVRRLSALRRLRPDDLYSLSISGAQDGTVIPDEREPCIGNAVRLRTHHVRVIVITRGCNQIIVLCPTSGGLLCMMYDIWRC